MNNFQRVGSISNAHIGREFEDIALNYFKKINIQLIKDLSLPLGINKFQKNHRFDLGTNSNAGNKVIVECKSHRWTAGNNVPSSKLTVWNEAMYYFHLASNHYRKIFFILRDYSVKRKETLGEYYVRTYKHLIPEDVEIMEYDSIGMTVKTL